MGGSMIRWQRAEALRASDPGGVERLLDNQWLVRSESGRGWYKVTFDTRRNDWSCNCEDFKREREACKHIYRVYLHWFPNSKPVPTPGEKPSERKVYTQNWAAYDLAQQEETRLFDVLLRGVVDVLETPGITSRQLGRPSIPLRDQAFCSIRKVYEGKGCRPAKGNLRHAVREGNLGKAPGYVVSSRFLNRPESTQLLERLVTLSALPLAGIDEGFAPDSTGMQSTLFGAWREDKHGEHRIRDWLKLHALVGIKTHAIVSVVITDKDGSDYSQFEYLIRNARQNGFGLKEVYADKAYHGRSNYAIAEELNFDFLSPVKRTDKPNPTGAKPDRLGRRVSSRLWTKMFHYAQDHPEEFGERYHQRSNVESVFSALKRKLGECLRSKTRVAQENEILAKVVAYNLTVLIHEFYEHGIVPDFLRNPITLVSGV
ncbi:MAG: transposase [Thermoplasmata archaeon]|nr:transposase [Thermoplasmata archaeon]